MPRRPPPSRVTPQVRTLFIYIISFVLFLKQKFKKKAHAIFQKNLFFFIFFFPFSSAENLKRNCPPLSLIGKQKINLLLWKKKLPFWNKKKKNQKTFSISGCNDVKNSSHYIHIASCYTIIIIIIIDYFTKSIFFVKLNIHL